MRDAHPTNLRALRRPIFTHSSAQMIRYQSLLLAAALLVVGSLGAHAQDPPEEERPARDTCKVGMYILSLYDFDYPNQSFSADCWLWFLYTRDSLNPLESVEISNAKLVNIGSKDVEKKMGVNWATEKVQAVVKQEWDVRDFPFDRQTLKVVVEDADHDTSDMVYIPDSINSRVGSSISLDGWRITSTRFTRETARYETSYGDPEISTQQSSYPAVVAYIQLKRKSIGLFLKLFSGVYIAFALCLVIFMIEGNEVSARLGLATGAIFATVANKYIVDSLLPKNGAFTLVDKIHAITFIFILLIVIASVISSKYYFSQRQAKSKMLDHWLFIVILTTYVALNLLFILNAM